MRVLVEYDGTEYFLVPELICFDKDGIIIINTYDGVYTLCTGSSGQLRDSLLYTGYMDLRGYECFYHREGD